MKACMSTLLILMMLFGMPHGLIAQADMPETPQVTQTQVDAFLRNSLPLLPVADDEFSVRATYRFTLNTFGAHERLIEEYGNFSYMYLIEYGYYQIEPIVSSMFACVGVTAQGELVKCKTPQEMLGRIYDIEAMKKLQFDEALAGEGSVGS